MVGAGDCHIFGAFVSILDTTVINTALPQIQRAFGSDLHVASYVTTAYTLAQGVIIAASGFLANRFGIKRMYLLSLALFTLGSVLCGLAWNSTILILFRVLQGGEGLDSEVIWIFDFPISDTGHIFLLGENELLLSLQGGIFLCRCATHYISLRNPWAIGIHDAVACCYFVCRKCCIA